MRIGICLRTWGEKGGIGVYTRNLLAAILSLRTEHEYCLFYQNRAHIGQFKHHPNVKEIYVPARTKWLWDQTAVPYYANKVRVDVLFHTKTAVPFLARCKTAMVVHGSERLVYPEFSHKSDMLFFKTVYRMYLRRATAIITVSENTRKDLIRFLRIDPEKIKTVYLASPWYFRRVDDKPLLESIRAKYTLPYRFILNVGLIYPGKNLPNLLNAFKLIREKEDIRLVIAGFGRRMYKDDLKTLHELRKTGDISLPGYIPQEDLVAVYNLAELFAFPSFYESFGLVSLEAMACGCPVVVSRTGGAPEAAGDAAIYVDPLNVEEIAEGMLGIMTDPELRHNLIEKGLQNVRRFSWEKTARQTLDALESLVMPEEPGNVGQTHP